MVGQSDFMPNRIKRVFCKKNLVLVLIFFLNFKNTFSIH